jgi:hypothetical protein
MKQYKIFKHPSGTSEAIKQGWSWPAFFFSYIWAMVKKQWALGVTALIAVLMFGFVVGAAGGDEGGDALINIVSIIINIVFGINGNLWREKNLISRGYELMDTVTAANPEGAVALYLKAANAES